MGKTEAQFRISAVQVPPPPPPPVAQTMQLTVSSTPLSGHLTTVSQSGLPVDSGLTPMTFVLTVGQAYVLGIEDAGAMIFDRWSDGNPGRERIIQPFSQSPINLVAVFKTIVIPPPPPPPVFPPPPPPPPVGGLLINSVISKFWHYITIGGVYNIYAELGYTAQQVVPSVRYVMVVRDGVLGTALDTSTHTVLYSAPGRNVDNVPVYRNLPVGLTPSPVNLEFYFTDPVNTALRISDIMTVQGVSLNTFSNTTLPIDQPTPTQPITLRVIYYAYKPLGSGLWQLRTVATYRAHSSIIGQGIRGRLSLFVPGSLTPFITATYSVPGIPASATGVIVMRTGTAAGVDPVVVDARTDVINAAGTAISNVEQRTVNRDAQFP